MSTQAPEQMPVTENEQKDVAIVPFIIAAKKWKTFEQENPPYDTVVWLKLANENVVLAIFRNNGMGATGWWQVSYKDGQLLASTTQAFIAKGALWQECIQF